MFHVKIDGKDLEFEKPLSILEAARTAGIEIPSLCYDQRLEAYGGCRLCLVQVEGHGRPDASCTTTITDGMKISTSTESIRETRRNLLEMMVQEKGMDTGGLDTRKDFYRYLVDYGVVRDDSRADMTVGFPNSPFSVGYGGLTETSGLRPSMDLIRAVSSPHM